MIDYFDKLYASIINTNQFLTRNRYYSALRFFIREIANKILPVYFYFTKNKKCFSLGIPQNRKIPIIVSLTSFPNRIFKVWLVIESILRQTEKPDQIILWLSKEQFGSIESLPQRLLKQQERGLVIVLKEGDLRSHKKYFYTLQEFPKAIMITLDDDIFYPSNTLSELFKWHHKFPNSIIARYGLKIKLTNNDLAPYKEWEENYQQESPDFNVFFGSGGGTLFPPNSLSKEALNSHIFTTICMNADDVWLNTMCRLKKTKIYKINHNRCSLLPVLNQNNITLSRRNVQENLNDRQLRGVRKYFIINKNTDPYMLALSPKTN